MTDDSTSGKKDEKEKKKRKKKDDKKKAQLDEDDDMCSALKCLKPTGQCRTTAFPSVCVCGGGSSQEQYLIRTLLLEHSGQREIADSLLAFQGRR